MVNFVVCFFVVAKGYCEVAMMLLDLLHDTSVNHELIDCAQYAFYSSQLSFVPYFIHWVYCLMYFATRSIKILYGVLRHVIGLVFLSLRFIFFGSRTVLSDSHHFHCLILLPDTSSKLKKILHLEHFNFAFHFNFNFNFPLLPELKKSLVDVMFPPIACFSVFLQLHLLLTKLIKPLLLNDS